MIKNKILNKRYINLILFLFLLLSLVGCREKVKKDRVVMISILEDKEEKTPSKEIYEGLNQLNEKIDLIYTKKTNQKELIKEIERQIKKDVKLVVTNSFIANNEIEYIASQNKDIKFLVIDSLIDPEIENVNSVFFKTNESSFLAGYLSGLKSESNIVGYIGFNEGLISDNYRYGYKSGVRLASIEKKKNIKVYEKLVDTFNDYNLGKENADLMYNNNVDVIYQTVGMTGVGVIDSAKENDKYVIGYDIDQSFLAPKNVLSSTIKNYSSTSYSLLNDYLSDKEFGQKITLGLKEKGVGLTDFNEDSIYSSEIDSKIKILEDKINKGIVNIPFDRESYINFLKENRIKK